MRLTSRITAISALSACALIGPAVVSALPANASTFTPTSVSAAVALRVPGVEPLSNGDILCNGDVCIQGIDQGETEASVKAWANRTTFTGHFEIINVTSDYANSPNQKWIAGGAGYVFTYEPEGTSYEVIAWKGTKTFTNIGDVQFTLGL
jgi:hypothetical protein